MNGVGTFHLQLMLFLTNSQSALTFLGTIFPGTGLFGAVTLSSLVAFSTSRLKNQLKLEAFESFKTR